MSSRPLAAELKQVLARLPAPDPAGERRKRERWLRLSAGTGAKADFLPIMIHLADPEAKFSSEILHRHWRYPLEEQIDNPEKMLLEWLPRLPAWCRAPNDAYLGIAPRFGNAFLLTAFGLGVVARDNMLLPARTLTRVEALALEWSDDFISRGLLKKAIEFNRYARAVLPHHLAVGLFFMMSPFDLAFLIRGQGLLGDLIEAPEAAHRLLTQCTRLFLAATLALKQAADEPADSYWYAHRLLQGGGHLCEDCCVMISPAMHREFSLPCTQRAHEALGGGHLHFCGDGRQLLESYLRLPLLQGIDFGQLEKNGPIENLLASFQASRKAFNYSLPRKPHEGFREYFKRFLAPLRRKQGVYLSLQLHLRDADQAQDLQALWHEMQAEHFADSGCAALTRPSTCMRSARTNPGNPP